MLRLGLMVRVGPYCEGHGEELLLVIKIPYKLPLKVLRGFKIILREYKIKTNK